MGQGLLHRLPSGQGLCLPLHLPLDGVHIAPRQGYEHHLPPAARLVHAPTVYTTHGRMHPGWLGTGCMSAASV